MTILQSALARKTIRRIESLSIPLWAFPIALLLLGLVAYGLLLPKLGFYWDDWAKISVSRLWGLSGYWAYYASDRPLSAWTHIVFTYFLGVSPLAWQIFTFALTLLSGWGVYWVMSSLWPRARWQSAATALLFLIYPVFTAHAIAVTFHQQWLQYALFFISVGLMIQAFRKPHYFWLFTALSILLSGLQLTVTEYFAPLELIRPVVLWLLIGQAERGAPPFWRRLCGTFVRYLPYLAAIAVYGIWRMFFMHLSGGDPYQTVTLYALFKQPVATISSLIRVATQDSLHTLVSTWAALLIVGQITTITPFQWIALVASLAAALGTMFFLSRLNASDLGGEAGERGWQKQALLLGLVAFVLGCTPAWATGRQIVFDAHSDRYALPAIFGASLLWVTLITLLSQHRAARSALLALLVGLGTGVQMRAGNDYRWIWETQRDFYWELYWRAPQLAPGTALLTYQEVFPNQGLFSSSAALNLLYPQPPVTGNLAYWWYTLSPRYHVGQFSEPIHLNFSTTFRSLSFKGGTPNSLLVNFDPTYGNCLYVVTKADQNDPALPSLVKDMASITNLSLIQPQPQNGWKPPEAMFGTEPSHTWCYYFEKGDLARQFSDWQQAASLGDQARAAGYSPTRSGSDAPQEWAPFIQAYAALGRWQDASDLTIKIGKKDGPSKITICALWGKLGNGQPASAQKDQAASAVSAALGCGLGANG
ncbi:MAG TPA: hypothetical protein VGJ97_12570 [Anaerolineaceae bacterium]